MFLLLRKEVHAFYCWVLPVHAQGLVSDVDRLRGNLAEMRAEKDSLQEISDKRIQVGAGL